jgi:hypothetical protein
MRRAYAGTRLAIGRNARRPRARRTAPPALRRDFLDFWDNCPLVAMNEGV